MQCSLIISTYNWPEALRLCITSVLKQVRLPNEIIIADDGSTDETKAIIEQFQEIASMPIVHVWHEDKGFRLAQIRNKALARCTYEYIIQIDGDLILHPHFVADHLFIARPSRFVSGSRVILSADTTKVLLAKKSADVKRHSAGNNSNFFNKFRHRGVSRFMADKYKQSGRFTYYVKGCNMAFWKKDIVEVNGYNEIFTGWGREDSELAIRLINAGIKKRFLKLGGVTYHLHHKEACRKMEAQNVRFMKDAIANKITYATKGLSRYLQQHVKQPEFNAGSY